MKGILCIFSVSILFCFLGSCRSAKKIQKAISKKDTAQVVVLSDDPKADSVRFIRDVFQKLEKNGIDFNTFSAKIKVHYQSSDGKNYDFNAYLRILKDSVIWVSINAVLGIEAFRVYITPDSVKVMNKLDKYAQLRSVSYLQELAHLPFDFRSLQNLLVGNPVYLDSNIVSYKKENTSLTLMSVGEIFKNYITLNRDDFSILHSKLDDVDFLRARTCELTYAGYDVRDNRKFSTYREITMAEKSKLEIELNFKQYGFNELLSFPFSIPKNYQRK